MPSANWPPPDRLAWLEALREPDPFEDHLIIASNWSPTTRKVIESGYGRWLAWLEENGLLEEACKPADRVSRERVRAYMHELSTSSSPFSVVTRLAQLGDALRAMAPQHDFSWVRRAAERLRVRAKPKKDVRLRMQTPSDLFQLGTELMRRGRDDPYSTDRWRAKLFRDGLMISFLALRPVRGSNLAGISLGEHLTRAGDGWQINFHSDETKQRRVLSFSWPDELVANLNQYLEMYRPVLLASDRKRRQATNRLWISSHGTPMTYSAIAIQIRDRTKAAFGTSVNPHLFRSCAATAIATCAPEQAAMIAGVLGHANLKVSEQHYNWARTVNACERHQAHLARYRHGKPTS